MSSSECCTAAQLGFMHWDKKTPTNISLCLTKIECQLNLLSNVQEKNIFLAQTLQKCVSQILNQSRTTVGVKRVSDTPTLHCLEVESVCVSQNGDHHELPKFSQIFQPYPTSYQPETSTIVISTVGRRGFSTQFQLRLVRRHKLPSFPAILHCNVRS